MASSRPTSTPRLLLAIAAIPPRVDALSLVASSTGISLSDVKLRLTGTLPRVLLSHTDAQHVQTLAAELEKHGLVTIVCDPAEAPGDRDRIVARQLELSSDGFVAIDRTLTRHPVAGDAVALLQRGWRLTATTGTVTTTERKVALGRAVLSGGLLLTKKVQKSSVQVSESREAFLLVERLGSEPDVILYERQLDYRFLGASIQPAAYGNLTLTVDRIRTLAPRAPLDQTVAQPGFVQKLAPSAVGDPLDLGLHLVRMDKWLWAARFFKTRSLAARACELGRVTCNGQAAKAAREVRIGDLVQVKNDGGEFHLEVLALSGSRGPASVAQTLYRETDASREARLKLAEERRVAPPFEEARRGKPSKRERRQLARLRDPSDW